MSGLAQRLRKAVGPRSERAALAGASASERALVWVGACGGVGYLPASGTVSVLLVGVPLYCLLQMTPPAVYAGIVIAFTFASVALHARGDRILGAHDSGALVWDELAGYWIAMIGLPFSWQLVALGFVVERGLDILKVFPANVLEDRLPGGWGVVADDVVAGLYALLVLHVAVRFAPGWLGV